MTFKPTQNMYTTYPTYQATSSIIVRKKRTETIEICFLAGICCCGIVVAIETKSPQKSTMLNKVVVVSGGGGRLERIRIAMLHPSSLLFLLPSSKKKVIMLLVLQGRVVPHCCSFSSRGTDGHAQQELESRWMVASSNAQELVAGSRMY